MKDVSIYTYIVLLSGMLSFFFGMIVTQKFNRLNATYDDSRIYKDNYSLMTSPFMLALYLLCTFFIFRFASNALAAAATSGNALMDGEIRLKKIFEGSAFGGLLYGYVIIPMFYVSINILAVSLLSKYTKRPIIFYLLSSIFIVSYFIVAGGRSLFVIILMYLLITIVCLKATKTKLNIPTSWIKYGVILSVFAMLGMSLQTGYRQTGKYEISEDAMSDQLVEMSELFLSYSVIPIKLFDIALSNDLPERLGGFQYGRATVAGADVVVCGIYRRITGDKIKSTAEITKYLQETWVPGVLPEKKSAYNYCYTAIFFNYMDLGILGAIIFPFIFGMLYRYYIYQYYAYKSLPSLMLVCFGYFMMLHSLFQCYFIKNWVLFFCFIMIIWHYINKKNILNNKYANSLCP